MPVPPFLEGRTRLVQRASHARPQIDHRVYYDPEDGYEYERCGNPRHNTWHQIDWRSRRYRDVDRVTGVPVAGQEGQWRALR